METASVIGYVKRGTYTGELRVIIAPNEAGTTYQHDCVIDAIISIALRKAGVKVKDGDILTVTVSRQGG